MDTPEDFMRDDYIDYTYFSIASSICDLHKLGIPMLSIFEQIFKECSDMDAFNDILARKDNEPSQADFSDVPF